MLQNELEQRIELESARIIEKKENVLITSVLTERLLGREKKDIDYTTFELTYSDGQVRTECVKNDSLLFRVYSSKCN